MRRRHDLGQVLRLVGDDRRISRRRRGRGRVRFEFVVRLLDLVFLHVGLRLDLAGRGEVGDQREENRQAGGDPKAIFDRLSQDVLELVHGSRLSPGKVVGKSRFVLKVLSMSISLSRRERGFTIPLWIVAWRPMLFKYWYLHNAKRPFSAPLPLGEGFLHIFQRFDGLISWAPSAAASESRGRRDRAGPGRRFCRGSRTCRLQEPRSSF